MKITRLEAECGENFTEIGRYGLSIEEAREAFLKTVKDSGNEVEKESKRGSCIFFRLKWDFKLNQTLLYKVAAVGDIHGDPAGQYYLEETEEVSPGSYVQTGTWSD
jgi:hypothetical protein